MELQNLNTLTISDLYSINENDLKQSIQNVHDQIKSLIKKEVIIAINNVYIDGIFTLDKLVKSVPFIGYLKESADKGYIKSDYLKIGLNTLDKDKYDVFIKVFIEGIQSLDYIIKNDIYIIEKYFLCINVLYKFINQQISEQVYFVDCDQLDLYYKKDDVKYLQICNAASKQEDYSKFSLKLMDTYLMTEKEWFVEQCEHLLHIADVLDGQSDNDLKENNWDIDIYKSIKIRSSLGYRNNPFNRSKFISECYPLTTISNYDIVAEHKENVKKLKNIYNKFNFFLYSSAYCSEYKKNIASKYNEYTPYSLYRLSNKQYNDLCAYYDLKPTNILLTEQYDFIQEDD